MKGEELTEKETALYDRQSRVWGVDAQLRLSKSQILVSGLTGTAIEFCKNIVLAGVGSITLNDDRTVTEEALSANFLIPFDEIDFRGKSVAEICGLSSFSVDFFDKFDVVVVSSCSLATKRMVNEKCHKLSKHVAFYAVDCRDSCGEIFVDLRNYGYSKESINIPWRSLPRRVSKLYFAMRVIERFEDVESRYLGETSTADLPDLLKLRNELCQAHSMNESQIPDSLLERLLAGASEFPPVCAIIGGILGQEVIKAISGKGDPLKNFFFYDAVDVKGVIEDVSNS